MTTPTAASGDPAPEHPTTLYRFFDAAGALLYIGISRRGPRRWIEHAAEKPWWPEVARATTTHFLTQREASQAEADAIRDERPRHNIRLVPPPPKSAVRRPVPPDPNRERRELDLDLDEDLKDAKQAAAYLGLTSAASFHIYVRRFPQSAPNGLKPAIEKKRYIRVWIRQDLDEFLDLHPTLFKRCRRKARDDGDDPS